MHLFMFLMLPGVLECCIESPEKIALELKIFNKKKTPYCPYLSLSLTLALTQLVSVSHHLIFRQLCYFVYMISHDLPKYILLTVVSHIDRQQAEMFWQICSLFLLTSLGRIRSQESEDQFVQTVQARLISKHF